MPRRRIGRFVVEALFLAAVAAAVTIADLRPVAVIALMMLAWIVVALLEWTAWLDEPHYGRGLPPRYYVPQVALPPPRAIEQYRPGAYPVLEPDDEPTFVASTQEWAATLEDWPVLDSSPAGEDTEVAVSDEHDELVEETPPPVPLPPVIEPELEDTVLDDGLDFDLDEEPTEDPVPADALQPLVEAEREPLAEPESGPEPVPEPVPERTRPTLVERPPSLASHRIDPLSESGRRRLFARRPSSEGVIEVSDGPPPNRTLPSRHRSQKGAKRR